MYPVSQNYLTALSLPAKIRRLTGTISNPYMGISYNFDDSNVLSGSFNVFNQCSDGSEVKIGTVCMGQLEAVFKGLDALDSMWRGLTITVSEGLLIGYDANDDPIWEDVPLGVFDIFEANHAEDGVHVTAYDRMHILANSWWTYETYVGYPYDFLTEISEISRIELAQTQEEIEELVNGGQGFAVYPENDIETCRDMLHWLAQALGAFATINREGKIELRAYKPKNHIDAYIGAGKRFRGASISDFETYYSRANYENIVEDETVEVFGTGNGLEYQFGANPLLQYMYDTPIVFEDIATYLFDTIHYTPFSVDMAACPAYDLGDNIELTNVKPGWSPVGCIMSYSYQYHGAYTIEGYGSNPALNNVMSATEKEMAQMRANSKSNEIQYYTFLNAKPVEIDNTWQPIINLRFGSIKGLLAVFQAEIKLYITPQSNISNIDIRYVYNGVVLDYKPQETYSEEGYHLLHLYYYFEPTGGAINTLRVQIKSDNATGLIAKLEARACLWGQGLVASDKWDGYVEFEEELQLIDFSTAGFEIDTIEDELSVSKNSYPELEYEESVAEITLATAPVIINPSEELYINKQRMSAYVWADLLEYTWDDVENNFLW